jgi:DNA topoisomerase-1
MGKDLVVVESPAKARTIGRILGDGYEVQASLGHVRDLPEDDFGIDVTDGFAPRYVVLKEREKVLKELAKLAKGAQWVYLATDPDREGEAISWHLIEAAGLRLRAIRRVVFHEITEEAVKAAFRSPRTIDMHLVNAQQARRLLDRVVGYRLSPFLWQTFRWPRFSLSAGRVQSAALRLVVEREREVQGFIPQEYWTLTAILAKESREGESAAFPALLHSIVGQREKLHIPDQAHAQKLLQALEGARYTVHRLQTRESRSRPAPPFTTSTMQQEAGRKLRFPARRTMTVAQQLYEGVPLGVQGPVGLITYMRTDSTHVASSAQQEALSYIRGAFGPAYAPPHARAYRTRTRNAQEAHEAIRPTSVRLLPEQVKASLTPEQHRLYELVWKRFVASQMADALSQVTRADIHALSRQDRKSYLFRATGSVPTFLGYRALYREEADEPSEEPEGKPLPPLAEGEALRPLKLEPEQHFTQPPPRYSEASLIKALEERGIGRPSTYAAIVSTIRERGYTRLESGRYRPEPLGLAVNDLLSQHFPQVVDLGFTAQMEEELDEIARGEREWNAVLREFYEPFAHDLEEARQKVQRADIPTGEACEKCGKPMVLKRGRFGLFLACSGYPQCHNARSYLVKAGVECPRCGGDLVERRARPRKGRRSSTFWGCSNYPTCTFAVNRRPLPQPCPQCQGLLVEAGRAQAHCTGCDYKGAIPQEAAQEASSA